MRRGSVKSLWDYKRGSADGFIVEFFLPKRLKYLSGAFKVLRNELEVGGVSPRIFGFSIYEVYGAFTRGSGRVDDEQTMVIRVFFDSDLLQDRRSRNDEHKLDSLDRRVYDLIERFAQEVCESREKEVWAMRSNTFVYKAVRTRNRGEVK